MDPYTAQAIGQGLKTAGKWAYNKIMLNRRKNFDRTPYAEYLNRLKENGMYPSSIRASAVNELSRITAPAARKSRTEMLGRLHSQGMGNSIAGTRALAEPGLRHSGQVGNYAAQLARINAESKAKAADEYGRAKASYTEQWQKMNEANNQQAIEGVKVHLIPHLRFTIIPHLFS